MSSNFLNSPYENIPNELLSQFTMNGAIPLLNWFFDGSKKQKIVWSSNYIDKFLAKFSLKNVESGTVGEESYDGISALLLNCFQKNGIMSKKVAVVGSETPWIEAILLNLNNQVTTIEYNVPEVQDDRINCLSYSDFTLSKKEFDCIVTFSSIEHSGLGRYGDGLNPNGDIEAMQTIHSNLKSDGIVIWGAPVGHDAVVWNAHRIYGKIRLPLIFENFDEMEWFGFQKDDLLNLPLQSFVFQPIVSLCKKKLS